MSIEEGTINPPQHPFLSGKNLYTPNNRFAVLRTPGTLDGASLQAAGYEPSVDDISWSTKVVDAATIKATNGMIDVWDAMGYGINSVQIALFSVDDSANDDFDLGLFVWKDSKHGPALPAFTTTGDSCKVGTYKCAKHPVTGVDQPGGLWVDTIKGIDAWPTEMIIADSTHNHICSLSFDLMGARYIKLVLWSGGAVSPASNIGAIITAM